MLSISDKKVQEVTVLCAIQFMKTELMINTAMYYMHQEPSPIIYVAPKKETAEAWSKERLVKSVNATPVLHNIFSQNRRGEGNTITQKQYPGGQISIVSAGNPTDLAMRACRIVLLDEVNKFPVNVGAGEKGSGGEGDPIAVVWGRSTTYGARAKKIVACSPTVENKCRVSQEYSKSNQGIFQQKCKHCGHEKFLTWPDVKIPKDEEGVFKHEEAAIVCSECGSVWDESDRLWSIRHGNWKILKPEVWWHHGFKANSLASPFTPVIKLAKEFVDALDSQESLKAFYNTRMAETWKEQGERPEWERLYERREDYELLKVPPEALLITCGIDVQKDYLVYEVTGWGRRKENWVIDKGVIEGDLEKDETKEKLTQFLDRTYVNSAGIEVPIMKCCLDSGYNTHEVYSFCREYGSDRVVAVKGDDNLRTMLGTPTPVDIRLDGKRITRGVLLWRVGSSVIKEQLYRWFNQVKPTDEDIEKGKRMPTGYAHFPMLDAEYFKQITAEQYVAEVDSKGFLTYSWKKMRKDNHFLDCKVYSRAASAMLQIDRMSDQDWGDLEKIYLPNKDLTISDKIDIKQSESAPEPESGRKIRRKGWIKRK